MRTYCLSKPEEKSSFGLFSPAGYYVKSSLVVFLDRPQATYLTDVFERLSTLVFQHFNQFQSISQHSSNYAILQT
ncbi:hypothetical protein TNCV_3896841 [Trichonephila clavipes]|nr:hypothetical protein TNCV_3896841 [Trichonephila clavipes]